MAAPKAFSPPSPPPLAVERKPKFVPGVTPYAQHHIDSVSPIEAKKRKREEKVKRRRQKIPLVTIHGVKGSVLTKSDGQIVWLTGAQAAGLSTPDISLPLKWKNGVQEHDDIQAKHTLKAVTVIPYLVGASLYEGWLNKSQTLGCPAYEFSYDWRRSLCETVVKFAAYLRWISAKHDGRKVQVVAHSMGGLITLATVHLYPELFHSVLFAGVPFRGGPGFFHDMHVGTPTGRNLAILGPKVLATFPSIEAINYLPGEHDDPNFSALVDRLVNPIPVDWFDVHDWKKQKMGIFSDPTDPPSKELEDCFANCLKDAKRFRALVQFHPDVEYPPFTVLASDSFPCRRLIMKDGPKSVRGYDFETCPESPGDGRVPLFYARPKFIPHEYVRAELNHETILNDERIPDLLLQLIQRAQGDSLISPLHPRL